MKYTHFFSQILVAVFLFGSALGPSFVLYEASAATDTTSKPPATCSYKEITDLAGISDATTREAYQKTLKANKETNTKNKDVEKYVKLPESVTEMKCGTETSHYISGQFAASTQPLQRLFDGDNPPCEISADSTIKCTPRAGRSETVGVPALTSVSRESLRLPICEMVEQSFASVKANAELKTFACSELMDPLPANFFAGNSDTKCVVRKIETTGTTYKIIDSTSLSGSEYCNAILSKTDGGFGAIFAFVRLLYDISLPILIALAVISLVGLGVFIMYAPNGGEDTMKKAKDMAFRVASGFLLLLLMRVFLGVISADLFGPEPEKAPTTASLTLPVA